MATQLVKPSINFIFEDHEIRAVIRDGEPWFFAADVCKAIALDSTSTRKLDDDEKGLHSMQTLGGVQEVSIISESGLYTLILRCRDAVKQGTTPYRFRKWVTGEVLPAIRKTGRYQPVNRQKRPTYRYEITLTYRDTLTGQEETLTGGCNTPEEIVRGTAKKFGYFIPELENLPMSAYY